MLPHHLIDVICLSTVCQQSICHFCIVVQNSQAQCPHPLHAKNSHFYAVARPLCLCSVPGWQSHSVVTEHDCLVMSYNIDLQRSLPTCMGTVKVLPLCWAPSSCGAHQRLLPVVLWQQVAGQKGQPYAGRSFPGRRVQI